MSLLLMMFAAPGVRAENNTSASGEVSGRQEGSVCFASYAPATPPHYDRDAVLIINEGPPAPVLGEFPRVLADHLDLEKKHRIKLVRGRDVLKRWTFRFKPNMLMMTLRRSKGYWHLEPSLSGKCK